MTNISRNPAAGDRGAPRPGPGHRYRLGDIELSAVVRSHGWWSLAPFEWDEDRACLRTATIINERPVAIDLTQSGTNVLVESWGSVGRDELDGVVRRMLWTDLDLTEFHARCRRRKRYRPLADAGAGRLLRSPSLWEDLVKVLATTNISWSGTQAMTTRLVDAFGEQSPLGRSSFPRPESIARVTADQLAERSGFGYRAGSLRRIAELVSNDDLDLDAWEDPANSDRAIADQILSLPGVGPYAQACILALCGRFGQLPIDSVFRARHPDAEAALRHYRSWGRWKYLAYWFGRKS